MGCEETSQRFLLRCRRLQWAKSIAKCVALFKFTEEKKSESRTDDYCWNELSRD